VQKGSFAAESADPGFSFIYTSLDNNDDGWQRWMDVCSVFYRRSEQSIARLLSNKHG
jgi:hypothetical protein